MKQLHYLNLAGKIQERRRLIKEDYRGLLCKRLGNHHLLPLTVTQGLDHAVLQGADTHHLDGFIHDTAVILVQSSPESGVRASAQSYQVIDGHVPQVGLLGQHHTDGLGQFLVRIVTQITPHD